MSGRDIADRINVADQAIRKIVVPLVSIAGIIYEELDSQTDGKLLGVYLAMLGFGMVPWVRDMVGGTLGGTNGTHGSSPAGRSDEQK